MARVLIAAVTVALSGSVAVAQIAATPTPLQPVPGAMPDSDTVPSTLSPKNARDDALPVAAFRLKGLSDAQRQAIYHAVMADPSTAKPAGTPEQHLDIGTVLPLETPLQSLSADVARAAPELNRVAFQIIGNKLVLVDPVYREVLAVIAPSNGGAR